MYFILLNIFIFFQNQIPLSEQGVIVKCRNNITEGNLVLKDVQVSNINKILHEILKINQTSIHYTKIEIENDTDILYSKLHPFVNAVHLAYANHLNLVLTPDIIWYLIISGTSVHMNKNAQELRHDFVEHEGKKTISVRRDYFMFNSTGNKWDGVVKEFAEKVELNLKPKAKNLFNATFSTTNEVNSICSKIVLMAAMQEYFSYKLTTLCGIPEIKLSGSKDDWTLIKSKILHFNSTIPSLSIWYDQLNSIIDKFIDAFDGNFDYEFWSKIYKVSGGSGGPYISGWILSLFPYIKKNLKNYFVWEKDWTFAYDLNYMSGLLTSDFPIVFTNASFTWEYYNDEYSMSFLAGMVGVKYYQMDHAVQPIFGYAVVQN